MIARSNLTRHALYEIDRVRREGGIARTVLPHPETGELMVGEIDQRGAKEIVAWLTDKRAAELQEREQRREPLSDSERELLRLWRQHVPHAYALAAASGGPSFLIALNADDRPTSDPPEELTLAAHPSRYDIGWEVPKTLRAIPGLRGPGNPDAGRGWSRTLIATLRFPPGADLLYAWTRLVHLNDDFWNERRLGKHLH